MYPAHPDCLLITDRNQCTVLISLRECQSGLSYRKGNVDTVPKSLQLVHKHGLRPTRVFDTYWRFAAARQELFMKRVGGAAPPWTTDPVLAEHRFTNPYRASDRVSQYLIRNVIYSGEQTPTEIFFRTLLFKIFNRIDTWEYLRGAMRDEISWETYNFDRLASILDSMFMQRRRIYSAAYIMPSPPFGEPRKHRNHLRLLEYMIRGQAPCTGPA